MHKFCFEPMQQACTILQCNLTPFPFLQSLLQEAAAFFQTSKADGSCKVAFCKLLAVVPKFLSITQASHRAVSSFYSCFQLVNIYFDSLPQALQFMSCPQLPRVHSCSEPSLPLSYFLPVPLQTLCSSPCPAAGLLPPEH